MVGPNGMGKTTVMKLLARRKLPVPDFIDILLVEQEVVGDDRSALESVVAADVELQQLRKRKMELEAAMERVAAAEEKGGEEGSAERDRALAEALEACRISEEDDSGMQGKLAMEAKRKEAGELTEETFDLSVELNKTYDRLEEKNDATAEARAAKILHGLGFTVPESKTNIGPERFSMHNTTKSFSGGGACASPRARAVHRADVSVAGRAHQPPRFTSRDLARGVPDAVEKDAAGGVARPRLFVIGHDGHHPPARPQAVAVPRIVRVVRGDVRAAPPGGEQAVREVREADESGEGGEEGAGQERAGGGQDAAAKKADQKRGGKNKGMMQDDDDDGRGGDAAPTRWNDYSVEFHFPTPSELPPPLISLTDCHSSTPTWRASAWTTSTSASTWARGWASSGPTARASPRS